MQIIHSVVEIHPLSGYNVPVFKRNLSQSVNEALGDTPVVMLIGARQVGKSTLAKSLFSATYEPEYLTFDDATVLAAAKQDPTAFLEAAKKPVIFDEIQRVPELFLPIKTFVDRKREPGAFLLTGSANVLLLPTVADSLAGRMEVLTLRPLSQGEIEGTCENFIDRVTADTFEPEAVAGTEDRSDLFQRMLTGGYPEAVSRKAESRRSAWFGSYISTILQRDVRDLANIEGLAELPRLVSLLAARSGGLLSFADISRSGDLPQTTLKRYMALLNQIFLIDELPAYSGNLTKRLTKSSKMYITDTGLASFLQGLNWEKIKFENSLAGLLLENFVFSEIQKQLAWNLTRVNLMHFRTSNGEEVDLILELPTGEVVGIEVKAAAAVGNDAFRGLRFLEKELGRKFKRGVVIYTGEHTVAFDKKMFAVPVQSIWSANGSRSGFN